MNEEQNDLNQDNNTQPIPQFIINSGLDVTFHGAHSNGEIQVETSLLSNGIYEKHYQDGKLIESISKIKDDKGGRVETRFNAKGERLSVAHYQKDGVPTLFQFYNGDKMVERTEFFRGDDNILFSKTTNEKGETIQAEQYDENYQVKNSVRLEDGKIIQEKETEMTEKGFKLVRFTDYKTKQMMVEVFTKEGKAVAEYHYKNDKLTKSLEVRTDDNGYDHLKQWDDSDPSLVVISIFNHGTCMGRQIYRDDKYIGFVECIRDASPNRYEVLFDAQGNKISCSTYNQNNELIEKGVYENGIYRITSKKSPQNNTNNGHDRTC